MKRPYICRSCKRIMHLAAMRSQVEIWKGREDVRITTCIYTCTCGDCIMTRDADGKEYIRLYYRKEDQEHGTPKKL